MHQLQKICQFDNPYLGEFNLMQHIIMMVVCDNVTRVGLYGTVDKLVVIGV